MPIVRPSGASTHSTSELTADQRLAALPPRETFDHANGRLSYREAGSGPLIVFLHGVLGSADSWVWQFAHLTPRFHVVAWDAPGYGLSDTIEPDVTLFVDALEALLAHLGAESATLVGHSMGGVVSAAAAARPTNIVERLILSCTHPGYAEAPGSPPRPKLLQRLDDLETLGAETYGRMRAQGMVAPQASACAVELAARVAAQTRPEGLFCATRMLQFADVRPFYERIRARTLIAFGAQDPVVRPEMSAELRRLTPFAKHIDLPYVGHAPYFEDPETYSRMVRTFVETE